MNRRYLIPSLFAAGFMSGGSAKALPVEDPLDREAPKQPNLFERFTLDHSYDLAAHRSHSSHRSHRSHRSSSGGGYGGSVRSTPVPNYPSSGGGASGSSSGDASRNYNSTPPTSVLPSPSSKAQTLRGNTEKFSEITKRVQALLYGFGYYTGAIDGIIGPQTRAALSKFQSDRGLEINGNITAEVLNELRIVAQ